jgi:hypothetical protein
MPGRKDWTGQRFGPLVAVSFVAESITIAPEVLKLLKEEYCLPAG